MITSFTIAVVNPLRMTSGIGFERCVSRLARIFRKLNSSSCKRLYSIKRGNMDTGFIKGKMETNSCATNRVVFCYSQNAIYVLNMQFEHNVFWLDISFYSRYSVSTTSASSAFSVTASAVTNLKQHKVTNM